MKGEMGREGSKGVSRVGLKPSQSQISGYVTEDHYVETNEETPMLSATEMFARDCSF